MNHAVILAGGAGTRLWPLSRRARPKQLMRLFDGASLLQVSRRRLAGLFAAEQTWVITAEAHRELVAAELPDLPCENIIGEPIGRDTANAIGLAAELIALRDPDATMAVFTADHLIDPQAEFDRAIRTGLSVLAAHPTALVTFGIVPERAECGYGYLKRGAEAAPGVYAVAAFREKPAQSVAEEYFRSGEYLWNSGMFAWRVDAIRAQLRAFLPESARQLATLAARWRDPAQAAWRRDTFAALQKISIDFAVMERAAGVLTVATRCRWLDLGSWTAVAGTCSPDADGNYAVAPRALLHASTGNIVVSEDEHLTVLLGVRDLVVIHSPDATLVCHRDHAQTIRDLAAARQERFGDQYE